MTASGRTVEAPRDWRVLARHQLGSLAATLVDFGVMIACVHAGLAPTTGTAIGASCGAVTNFTLGRHWIFRARAEGHGAQAVRYAVVSLASLGLNTLGEFIVHDLAHVQYLLARLIVAVAVSLAWNYPLQRTWVFASSNDERRTP